jgi:hypothetical protein
MTQETKGLLVGAGSLAVGLVLWVATKQSFLFFPFALYACLATESDDEGVVDSCDWEH